MKKTIKTSLVLAAYQVLSQAKYTKMDDADKIKVWKIARKLAPVATKFEEDSRDAAEKMKPEINGGFDNKLQKAQEFERMKRDPQADMSKAPMGAAEYEAFIKELHNYNKLVGDAVKEFAEKEVKIEFDLLSEDSFGKLMASNEWTIGQVATLGEMITE